MEMEKGLTRADEQIYLELREFLDGFPGGMPDTGSDFAVKVLSSLFTPEEARMLMRMRRVPEPAASIARRCGIPKEEARKTLDRMAEKGLVWRMSLGGGGTQYLPIQYIMGMLEESVLKGMKGNTADKGLLEILAGDAAVEYVKQIWNLTPTKQLRVVPVGEAVDAATAVAPYDRMREVVGRQESISVMPCICKELKGAVGEDCGRSHLCCISFGTVAEHMIEVGIGKRISSEEALGILDRAEEEGMVLQVNNALEPLFLCCCCSCCCGLLRAMHKMERPADEVHSSFQAKIDPEACSLCGNCLERCQMGAISEEGDSMRVDLGRCIGCGLCVAACPEGAVSLVPKPGAEEPPLTYLDNYTRMARERNLPMGRMNPLVRKIPLPRFLKTWGYLYRLRLARPVIYLMARLGMV